MMDVEHKRDMLKKKMKGMASKKGKNNHMHKMPDGSMMSDEEMKKKHGEVHK